MTERRKRDHWANRLLDKMFWWHNLDLKVAEGLAPSRFWRWKTWQKVAFVLVVGPLALLVMILLPG